jgi:hypothetical protein
VSIESAPPGEIAPRADLVSALVWVAFGLAVAIGAWKMDRLTHLHINKYEIPGLVPGLLGAAIVVLGFLLALRAVRAGALRPSPIVTAPASTGDRSRMVCVFAAMVGYSVLLVGRGLPFWLITAVFVAAFTYWFDRERQTALGRPPARQAALAITCGIATSAIVTFVFQTIFYVRLP